MEFLKTCLTITGLYLFVYAITRVIDYIKYKDLYDDEWGE